MEDQEKELRLTIAPKSKDSGTLNVIKYFLTPDFEVLADYPGSIYKIGDIISPSTPEYCEDYLKFPALFRKMDWFEGRRITELLSINFIEVTAKNTKFAPGTHLQVSHFEYEDLNSIKPKITGFWAGGFLFAFFQCQPSDHKTSNY